MNNNLVNMFNGKDKKRYEEIIQLLNQKRYNELFDMDKDEKFGLSNQTYIDSILYRIKQEVSNNPDFLMQMNQSAYHRRDFFNEYAVESNPDIVDSFIEKRINITSQLLSSALDKGYKPSDDFINSHIYTFKNADIMEKLMDKGYKPPFEKIENDYNFIYIFKNEKLLSKLLDMGFKPGHNFLVNTNVLYNPNLVDRIIDTIDLTPEIINDESLFLNNQKAQQKIISKKPELLLSIREEKYAEQFWIEAFKKGYVP